MFLFRISSYKRYVVEIQSRLVSVILIAIAIGLLVWLKKMKCLYCLSTIKGIVLLSMSTRIFQMEILDCRLESAAEFECKARPMPKSAKFECLDQS